MPKNLKIKIAIADRIYPVTVDSIQEESLRVVAKKINAMIKDFEESYAVRDKQDALAMCVLQLASQIEQKQINAVNEEEENIERIHKINLVLDKYINN